MDSQTYNNKRVMRKIIGGIPYNDYNKIHQWLWYHYGKADHCENPDCDGTNKRFQWALKKGYEYKKDPTHFKQLCQKCHKAYDGGVTEEMKSKIRKSQLGQKRGPLSKEHKEKLSSMRIGKGNSFYGKKHSDETKAKMREAWARRKANG